MKRILLLLIAALPAFGQFGNATRLQSVPICAPLTQTDGYILTFVSATHCWQSLGNGGSGGSANQLHSVTFVFNGGSSTLATGDSGLYPGVGAGTGTINRVDISGGGTAGAACSVTVDIWKRNAAIPTSSQKISASAPATLSSANLAQNGSRSGWVNTAVAAGDVFGASIATVTGCITALVQVWYQ